MEQQSFNKQNQQNIMQQPPEIITTKDAAYINDMLAWNLLIMKKAHFAASHCQDQTVKTELEKCGQMHQLHYQQILNHLNTNKQNQQMM